MSAFLKYQGEGSRSLFLRVHRLDPPTPQCIFSGPFGPVKTALRSVGEVKPMKSEEQGSGPPPVRWQWGRWRGWGRRGARWDGLVVLALKLGSNFLHKLVALLV